jgi:hypothetical protein
MSSWGARKQLSYLSIVLGALAVIIGVPLFFALDVEPTCFDGKQNAEETGVDCGGTCVLQCQGDVTLPVIHWARAFEVSDGVYDLAAMIENTNATIGSTEILYQFKMYDDENLLIQDRLGKSFALPGNKWVIFESKVLTGERDPKRVFIDFVEESEWIKVSLPEEEIPDISVTGQRMEERNGKPRLSVSIANRTPSALHDIEVVAVVSDGDGNVLGVSRTYVETLEKYGEQGLVFTWRDMFDAPVAKIDIIPRVNYIQELYDETFLQ